MPTDTYFNLPEAKRSRLLEVLLEEFSENDYKNVSIERIAARAGIAKGSFYQYFEDKRDCYLYLIQLGIEEKAAFLRQQLPAQTSGQAPDLFAHLRWLVDVGARFQFSSPHLAKIGYKAIFDDVPLPEETMQTIRRGSYTYLLEMVQQGIANGTLAPDVDSETAAFLLNIVFTDLGKYLMQRFEIAAPALLADGANVFERADIHRIVDQVLLILENGLRRKAT